MDTTRHCSPLRRQFDLHSGECIREFFGHEKPVECLSLSKSRKLFASSGGDRSMSVVFGFVVFFVPVLVVSQDSSVSVE